MSSHYNMKCQRFEDRNDTWEVFFDIHRVHCKLKSANFLGSTNVIYKHQFKKRCGSSRLKSVSRFLDSTSF